VCSPASGSSFPIGTTQVTCTATDTHGNIATGTFTVSVIYAWSNYLSPNLDGSTSKNQSSTLPVKFKLSGGSAGIFNAKGYLWLSYSSNGTWSTEIAATASGSSNTGNLYRYDSTEGQYIYNLTLKPLAKGTWRLRTDLGDGVVRTVTFTVK